MCVCVDCLHRLHTAIVSHLTEVKLLKCKIILLIYWLMSNTEAVKKASVLQDASPVCLKTLHKRTRNSKLNKSSSTKTWVMSTFAQIHSNGKQPSQTISWCGEKAKVQQLHISLCKNTALLGVHVKQSYWGHLGDKIFPCCLCSKAVLHILFLG